MNKLKVKEDIESNYIARLLVDNKIISIFNGRSESGPRSLGNRSIIFNPSIIGNNTKVNNIKGRENFRPLAGSILLSHFMEWFDTYNMEESPFMTYSFRVKEEKKNLIASVIHVDNTCRVQTVSKEQNLNYYSIIKSFFEITNIPLVGNTSFNLAGYPIVETVDDAIKTLYKSKINFLYFPEYKILLENSID